MTIARIEAIPFVLHYETPFRMASGKITEARHVLVRVRSDDGALGVGEAMSRPMIYGESQESIVATIERWIAPAVEGLDPFRTDAIQEVLSSIQGNHTAKGALDIALHDLRGVLLERSCWHLLGAHSKRLRVTKMLSLGSVDQVVREAASAAERCGVSSFKVKVANDVAWNVEVLTALRRELGATATLYVDANQALTLRSALETVTRAEHLGIDLLEEPVAAHDVGARARLAAASTVPIMADESAATLHEAGVQITRGSARALSIKTARTGFTESARILALAQALHCRTVIGSQGDSALGAMGAMVFGAAHAITSSEPAEVDYFVRMRDQIVADPPHIRDGHVEVDTSAPGVGAQIDEAKLQHYRVDK